MSRFEPLIWAACCALIVIAVQHVPELLDLLPDARPGKWAYAR